MRAPVLLPLLLSAASNLMSAPFTPVTAPAGETAVVQVPVRAERWDATSSVLRPASVPVPWHRGFYPGFAKAKREAEALRRPAALPRTATGMPPVVASSAAAALVFEGPKQIDTQSFPPDSQIAAGPDSLVVAVNSLLAIYDKTGKPRGGYQSFDSFFAGLGITGQIFDPRLIFDPVNQRFILSATEIDFAHLTNGHILLAVSATSDPTQTWYKFAVDSKGRDASGTRDTFPDFAGLGLSSSAVYITTNQFQITSGCLAGDAESCNFSDAWIRVIALPELLSGNPSVRTTTFKNVHTAGGFPAFSIQPAVTYGSSTSEFLVAAEFSAYTQSTVNLFAIPVAGTPVLTASNLIVPPFNPPPNVVALGTSASLITDDYRSLNAVWTNGSLWWAHNVASPGSGNALVEWFQIGLPDLASASLVQSGQVSGAGDAYYPAITAKADGTAAMAFTTSNPYLYASAAFTERLPADPRGAMRGYAIYRPGEAAYEVPRDNRWGDYSGISPDPDGDSFWVIAEYAAFPNPNYGTAAAQLTAPPALTLSPQIVDFGEVLVGSAGAPKSFLLSNIGSTAVTLGTVSFNGTNAADFAVVSDPCSGAALAPGVACKLTVSFHSSQFGPEWASITISDGGGSVTAALTGFGTHQAILSVTPIQLTFPATLQQMSSAPQTLTLTNSGNIPASLPIAVTSGDFTQTNNCPTQLPAGAACQFQVVFRPTGAGPRSGQLESPDLSVRAALTGTGTVAPAVLLCPSTLTFSNQVTGTASAAQTAILTNTGSDTLFISRLTASGDFSETNDCSGGLPPRASAPLLSPSLLRKTGTRTGSLTIASNLATPPQLAFTGSGVTHSAGAPPTILSPSAVPAQPATTQAAQLVADSPLAFESNNGQFPARIAFLARAEGHSVAITPTGLDIGANLSMTLRGASPLSLPAGEEPVPSKSAYLLGGDHTQWRTAIPAFSKVKLRGVYPGIDLVYYGKRRRLEYDFIVSAGADPAAIRLLFDGTSQLRIDSHGDLIVPTSGGDLRFRKPDIFQGDHHPIKGGYRLLAANEVGFRLGKYNTRRPLTIDPLLAFSTYVSGSAKDSFGGLAVDPAGNVYITGTTSSPDFPVTAAAFQKSCGGTDRHCDFYSATSAVFVSKFSPQGLLLYSTYLGGSGRYQGNAIAVDAAGNAYVTGVSFADDFPITDGAFQTTCKGTLNACSNAFVTKLSPDGSALVYSTFLGGSAGFNTPDQGMAIAVDATGNAVVGGTAGSIDFPTTPGAVQTTAIRLQEGTDAGHGFVAKLNAAGTGLVYSTYLGGTGADSISSLVVDASGNAYVAGKTNSLDFPVANAFQSGAYSPTQAFTAKFSPSGALLYATYLGGEGYSAISDLAVDTTGAAYLTGFSDGGFPLTRGALVEDNSTRGGFVTKLHSAGCALSYSTFLPPVSAAALSPSIARAMPGWQGSPP